MPQMTTDVNSCFEHQESLFKLSSKASAAGCIAEKMKKQNYSKTKDFQECFVNVKQEPVKDEEPKSAKDPLARKRDPNRGHQKCSIPTCQYRGSKGLFSFPSKDHMRVKWMEATGVMSNPMAKRICFQHFEPSMYHPCKSWVPAEKQVMRLLSTAVPTLLLPNSKEKNAHDVQQDHDYSGEADTQILIQKLRDQNESLMKDLQSEKNQNKMLKNKLGKKQEKIVKKVLMGQDKDGYLSEAQIDILLQKDPSSIKWSQKDLEKAKDLNAISPQALQYVRTHIIPLPSITDIEIKQETPDSS